MRFIYMSDKEAMVAMKYRAKNRLVNPRTELYYGFVLFTKDVCGVDFLRAINDGRVQIGFVDSEPIYEHKITYFRNDKVSFLINSYPNLYSEKLERGI